MAKKKPKSVDQFLEENEGRQRIERKRCQTCRNWPEVDKAMREFFERKRERTTDVPFKHFCVKYLQGELGCTLTFCALRYHAVDCLGVDVKNGQPTER